MFPEHPEIEKGIRDTGKNLRYKTLTPWSRVLLEKLIVTQLVK
jgi:hypothetical protein